MKKYFVHESYIDFDNYIENIDELQNDNLAFNGNINKEYLKK